jgi:hypothetical protein
MIDYTMRLGGEKRERVKEALFLQKSKKARSGSLWSGLTKNVRIENKICAFLKNKVINYF